MLLNFEEWKPVEGYKKRYEVSSNGRIRSKDFRDSLGRLRKGRILSPYLDERGYPRVCLCEHNVKKQYRVHRLVAIGFIPNPKNLKTVNHKNGIKEDNFYQNLEWNSYSQNAQHATDSGLWVYGTGEGSRGYRYPTAVLSLNGEYLYTIHGNLEMKNAGFDYRLVSKVCLGKRKSHAGHKFKRIKL